MSNNYVTRNQIVERLGTDRDGCGVYSQSVWYGYYECYKHLSGDRLYVAVLRFSDNDRKFFSSVDEMMRWVEQQPIRERSKRLNPDIDRWLSSSR